jgi:hypothetical protein
MAHPLALFALAAGAFFFLGRRGSGGALPVFAPDPKSGTGTQDDWSETWTRRQQALVDVGINIGSSGPKGDGVDGNPGPRTRAGVEEFQGKAGIPVDGKWGPITDAAMVKALTRLAQGFADVVTTAIGSQIKAALGIKEFVEGWWSNWESAPGPSHPSEDDHPEYASPRGMYFPELWPPQSFVDQNGVAHGPSWFPRNMTAELPARGTAAPVEGRNWFEDNMNFPVHTGNTNESFVLVEVLAPMRPIPWERNFVKPETGKFVPMYLSIMGSLKLLAQQYSGINFELKYRTNRFRPEQHYISVQYFEDIGDWPSRPVGGEQVGYDDRSDPYFVNRTDLAGLIAAGIEQHLA